MKALRCLVLMPFSNHYSFVYNLAIKEAVDNINKELLLDADLSIQLQEVILERADESLSTHEDVVAKIRNLIKQSHIIIIDISGFNPNVLWELGYSTALRKHIIVICENWENLPFNIKVREICKYDFSYENIVALRSKLFSKLKFIVPIALREKESLIRHPEFETASKQVMSTLKNIKGSSILEKLAINELKRIGKRFENLGEGLFELRNEKPYEEVIRYYCEYVSQLKGTESKFDVVSNLNFWQEITDAGDDYSYILANFAAAERGAQVKRVILIDEREFPNRTLKAHDLYSNVLKMFYEKQKELQTSLQTKILFSKHFDANRRSYSNFGILTKGEEVLVFNPQYDGTRMKETTFTYFNKSMQSESSNNHSNVVDEHEAKFRQAWNRGEDLDEKHFS